MKSFRSSTLACALAVASCREPVKLVQGQIVLYLDTDAPVPAAAGGPPSQVQPLFDRLLVDVYPPGVTAPCSGCTNEFQVDSLMFTERRASVGIAPPAGGSGYLVRVRLYWSRFADPSGEPNEDSSIDVTAALPAVAAETVTEATIELSTDAVGVPVGSLASPVQTTPGAPGQSLVGSWPGAQTQDCVASARPHEVCVPGGAYWMGNPNLTSFTPSAPVPRLVILSPFFLDATETTVADYRAAKLDSPESWDGMTSGFNYQDVCNYTPAPGPFDNDPLVCVSRALARAYCQARGADLPSEAQFEYAASARSGRTYPWGEDDPTCKDAVWGRGGWGLLQLAMAECKPALPPGGPLVPGSGARDRVDLPGGSILDLGGNVAEWMLDFWNRMDEPCWMRPGVYQDPVCTTPSPADGPEFVVRSGPWYGVPQSMWATARQPFPDAVDPGTGFRCARADQ